jgi:MoxR-like ATPase
LSHCLATPILRQNWLFAQHLAPVFDYRALLSSVNDAYVPLPGARRLTWPELFPVLAGILYVAIGASGKLNRRTFCVPHVLLVNFQPSSPESLMIFEIARRLRENIQKVIVGKDDAINLTLVAVLCEGHVLLEDVPGIGKTTLARALAASLGCAFRRIQFTPDLLPSDVTGLNWFNQKAQEFEYRPGPVMSQVVLADEINRATPRTQSALLEAMQERQVTIDGVTRPLPRPFIVMATQNPVELEGTFPLPEAQVDRFMLQVAIGYPSETEENAILERFRLSDPLPDLQAVTRPEEILHLQAERRQVRVEESLRQYIVRVARATRQNAEIELGASPRATMALFQSAQAWAAIQGRDYVIPDDVKKLAPYVLTHRLMISPQAQLRGRKPAELMSDIVDSVPVPVEG